MAAFAAAIAAEHSATLVISRPAAHVPGAGGGGDGDGGGLGNGGGGDGDGGGGSGGNGGDGGGGEDGGSRPSTKPGEAAVSSNAM